MTNQYSYAADFAGKMPEVTHKKAVAPNISSAAKIYMMSKAQKDTVVNVYKSGNDNGQKYMTGEDFVTYFRKNDLVYVVDKPILYSSLKDKGMTREQIATYLCERCNELGRMDLNEIYREKVGSNQKIC